jgi:hypothetical protein
VSRKRSAVVSLSPVAETAAGSKWARRFRCETGFFSAPLSAASSTQQSNSLATVLLQVGPKSGGQLAGGSMASSGDAEDKLLGIVGAKAATGSNRRCSIARLAKELALSPTDRLGSSLLLSSLGIHLK